MLLIQLNGHADSIDQFQNSKHSFFACCCVTRKTNFGLITLESALFEGDIKEMTFIIQGSEDISQM